MDNIKSPYFGKKVVFISDDSDAINADGKRGHLEVVADADYNPSFYAKYGKRFLDLVLSFGGLIVLSPFFLVIAIAIFIEDPGPIFFSQKRIGQNKKYFKLHKFRSMKISTPHDVPTHMLDNPEQYITKVGRFLRSHSLDELPQIWDILVGNMSVIGPRPCLWNQDVLIAERDKYGANDVKPGLTGWAQINGRDELSIIEKARLDGEYCREIGIVMDFTVFLRSLKVFANDESVVEGNVKKMNLANVRQKKILLIANHFHTLYAFRNELIQKLVSDKYNVYLSIPNDENDYFTNMGCKVIITDVDRRGISFRRDLRLILDYKRIFSDLKPDIILSFTIKPNIYGCLANGKKYKQICNITGTGATFLKDNFIAKICKFLYKISLRNAYKVYFQNTGDRDFFIKNKLVKNNYEILPGSGCNLEKYSYEPMPSGTVVRFIFIGRVMKLKGIDEYLEAAKIIKSKYPNTEFIIAGWNEEKEYIEIVNNYVNDGYVNYLGFRNDIPELIKKCDCTVLPSHGGEGIPNVLLESSASGRVCIGSRIHGTCDVIEDGVTGYLFEKGNSLSLAEAIEKFLLLTNDEKINMGLKARQKVEIEFDRKFVIEKYCTEILNV